MAERAKSGKFIKGDWREFEIHYLSVLSNNAPRGPGLD